jgi:VWFA-related protein
MRRLVFLLLLTGITSPAFAAKRVTVEQLQQALAAAQGKPDAELAQWLSGLELTERLSAARLAQLKTALQGEKARQALVALADSSSFLAPPPAEIPAAAAPDFAEQRRIMALTVTYVSKAIPQLPNFFATRETTRFEDTPQLQKDNFFVPYQPLHRVGVSRATVLYRDGREVVDSGAGKKPQPMTEGLTTVGAFGPILGTVLLDAAQSKLAWSRWEQGPAGKQAVFNYAVPREKSHYEVNYCCVAEEAATVVANLHPYRRIVGYRGEIAVDPASGTILRLLVEADLKPTDPVSKAGILVEYGPVEIGGKTYFCPVKSVSISLAQMVQLVGPYLIPVARQMQPLKTSLNDVSFEQYHMFRAETRVMSGNEAAPALPPLSSPDMNSDNANPSSMADNQVDTAAAGGHAPAPMALGGAPPSPEAAPAPPPESPVPEISLETADGVPGAPANLPPSTSSTGFVLHTTARLVDVGVVAFDKKGHPVTDLKEGDFEIYDNGRKQEVRYFSRASTRPAEEPASATNLLSNAPDQTVFANRRAVAASAKPGADESETSATILLIDASNLAWGDLTYARQEMLRFLQALPATERVGLYIMKVNGVQIIEEATPDHALLAAKLAQWMPSAQDLSRAQDEERRNRQQMDWVHSLGDLKSVNGNSVDAPDAVNSSDPSSALPPDAQLRENGSNPGRDALSILAGVARHLAAFQGHKNLVWVSSDNVLADWTDNAISIDKGSKFIDALALRAQEAMNDAHTSVYPLDASQLEAGGIGADIGTRNVLAVGHSDRDKATAILGDAAPGMKPGRMTAQMQQDAHPVQGTFRELADATGGRVFRRSGSIAAELNGVVDDGRAACLLSFTPDQLPDGKYHLLTVRLTSRRNITLRYRTGYQYNQEPATPRDRFRHAIWQPADVTEIALSANPVDAPKGATLKLKIAAADLAMAQMGELWTDKLDVFLVLRDDAGLRAQVTGQTLGLRLKPGTYQKMLREGIPFDKLVEATPQSGSVRIIVVDENSGRMGSVTVPAAALAAKH